MKDNHVFVDTNVFIYAIMEDERSEVKHQRAVSLFIQLSDQCELQAVDCFFRQLETVNR
mgnify:CR=1 FL=1